MRPRNQILRRLRATCASLYESPAQCWFQLLTAAVVIAYTVSTVTVHRPSSGYDSLWDGWIGNLAPILPLIPIALRIRSTARSRGAWIAMWIGIALYDAGNLIYLLHDQNLTPIPNPAPSDAAYLLSYVFLAIGITMLTQRNFGSVAIATRLDGAVTGLALGAAASMLWFDPLLEASGRPLQVAVGMAYPIMDLVIIVLLVSSLAPMRYRPNRSTLLLLLGMTAFVVGDVVYLNEVASNTYVQGTLLDATWTIGIWMMGLAAWPREDRRVTPRASTTGVPRGVAIVPIVFGCLAVAVVAIALLHETSPVTSLLALGALCLVLMRLTLTLWEVRRVEKATYQVARVDELTGLSNRRAFFEEGEARLHALDNDRRLGVIVVDLAGFKEINDTLGHAAGDELLRITSKRFLARGAGRGTIARIGGDEFACLFESTSIDEIVSIGRELATSFADPCSVDGVSVRVGGSFGIAVSPEHGLTLNELLRCADVAMYDAKSAHELVRLYLREDDLRSRHRLALVDDLRTTPWEEQLVLHFQPTLDLSTDTFAGLEALVRWRHPEFGVLYPDDFVSLTEQTGFIHALTRVVLNLAVAELARLDKLGYSLQMSVNISRYDLLDDRLPSVVDEVLANHGVAPSRLTLEVIETAFSVEPERAALSIERLRNRGIQVSIDDFGVGYSSLSQLLHLPVDELKIDKSFSLALGVDVRARAVVTATVELARALGLSVVAEGIESEQCLRTVRELGVDIAQGYYVAGPFSATQLERFLKDRPRLVASASRY